MTISIKWTSIKKCIYIVVFKTLKSIVNEVYIFEVFKDFFQNYGFI